MKALANYYFCLFRYMPEPNLPPLRVNLKTDIEHRDVLSVPLIQEKIPELPEQSRRKLIEDFGLRPETSIQLVNEPTLLDYFQNLTSDKSRNPTKVANFLINDLMTVLNKRKLSADDCPLTVKQLKELTDMLLSKDINLEICRNVLDELIVISDDDVSPLDVVEEKGWKLKSNEDELTKLCIEVLENNPKLVKQYKNGKTKVFKALLGILSKSNNKVDMSVASKIMEGLLKK